MEQETEFQSEKTERPAFCAEALFSDETENYVTPMEPKPGGTVTFRFRTGRDNADAVYLISGALRQKLEKAFSEGNFDYYETTLLAGNETIGYYFEILTGEIHCFYNKTGVSYEPQVGRPFCVIPGFSTPAWAKGAVMYQIFPDRFCNGDPSNDVLDREYQYIGEPVTRVKDWSKLPAAVGIREFYGGDLQGILDKLDYLQGLGVQVLYLNPVFVSPSNHKYDIQDYDSVDPHFGVLVKDEGELLRADAADNREASRYICRVTNPENLEAGNALFARLTQEVHRGTKRAPMWQRTARITASSGFRRRAAGRIIRFMRAGGDTIRCQS